MEIRRTLLIVAIAIVAYLMLISWQGQFNGQETASTTPASQSVEQSTENGAMVPQVHTGQTKTKTGVPVTDTAPDKGTTQKTNKNQLVNVKTDLLDVTINLQGAGIQSLQLRAYPVSLDKPDSAFSLLSNGKRLFEANSGLVDQNPATQLASPLFQADKSQFTLQKGQDKLTVELTYKGQQGMTVIKRYGFSRDSYVITLDTKVINQSGETWTGSFFGQLLRDSSNDPSVTKKGFATMATFLGGVYYNKEDNYTKLDFDDIPLRKAKPFSLQREGGWIGLSQHYFLTAWIGNADANNKYTAVKKSLGGEKYHYYLNYVTPAQTVAAGKSGHFSTRLYAGPKIQKRLQAVTPGLAKTIDYGWSWFIAEPIFAALVFLESGDFTLFGNHFNLGFGVGNWGLAIILLTIIIKLLFFKLSATSYRSMAKMRKVAPQMQRMKQQYKDDKQKLQMEMMKLYKREKINPVGGCLPMVIQAPVFIALYYVLLYSVELRQAPFYGWIQDLSSMDPYFILPIIMAAAMYVQFQLNPTPTNPTQAKVMKWMPIGMGVFFAFFPSGLVLYYVTNNILSISQQYWITRRIEKG